MNLGSQMSKLTKRVVDAAEIRAARILHLGRGPARLRAARPAQRSQAIHYTVPRRATIAPHQPRAQHRAHLRAGAKPGDHHHRRDQERRRSRRQARCRSARHHRQGTRRAVREGAHRSPPQAEHRQGLQADAGAVRHSEARQSPRHRGHTRRHRPAPSRSPAHRLRRQSLPGDDLQDVQPRRDVGPAAGRIEPAQAHQEVSGGEARAVSEPGRAASVSARCCARWSRKASSSPPPSPPFAC